MGDMTQETLVYPGDPGWKEQQTSKDAAVAMKPKAGTLRKMCLDQITRGACTPDECATIIGVDILSIRPRFSELKRSGLIEDTGSRRKNRGGKKAIVWGAT